MEPLCQQSRVALVEAQTVGTENWHESELVMEAAIVLLYVIIAVLAIGYLMFVYPWQ